MHFETKIINATGFGMIKATGFGMIKATS